MNDSAPPTIFSNARRASSDIARARSRPITPIISSLTDMIADIEDRMAFMTLEPARMFVVCEPFDADAVFGRRAGP